MTTPPHSTRTTPRSQHRRRPAATTLAAALGLTLLTGCITGPRISPDATNSTGAPITDTLGNPMTTLDVALAEQATIARTLVNDLVAQAPADDWREVRDGSDPCDLGLGERSPKLWIYDRRTFTIKNPTAQLDRLAATLTAKGWTLTPRPPRPGETERSLQKNGFLVSISAIEEGTNDFPVLDITASTPCVGLDGTINRRPRF